MCIRDRIKIPQERTPPLLRGEIGQVDRRGGLADPALEVVACLLYTSDAADERSSVDLGGRRIIKKKKRDFRVIALDHT